jgi:hypothetical protein
MGPQRKSSVGLLTQINVMCIKREGAEAQRQPHVVISHSGCYSQQYVSIARLTLVPTLQESFVFTNILTTYHFEQTFQKKNLFLIKFNSFLEQSSLQNRSKTMPYGCKCLCLFLKHFMVVNAVHLSSAIFLSIVKVTIC